MKKDVAQHTCKARVDKLLSQSAFAVMTHYVAGAAALAVMWGNVSDLYIYNWLSFFVIINLALLLYRNMFMRQAGTRTHNAKKFELWYSVLTGLTGLSLSASYCFAILYSDKSIMQTMTMICAMHLAASLIATTNSKQTMGVIVLTTLAPTVTLLFLSSDVSALQHAIGLIIFMLVIGLLCISYSNISVRSFEMAVKYDHAAHVVQAYKTKLEKSSIEDPGTHIFNRRFFNLMINEEVRRAKRAGTTFSTALIRVDYYDEYVAHYGEKQAQRMLFSVAKVLNKATTRGGEFMTRFDQRTFSLIAPNVQERDAIAFTSKMSDMLELADLEHKATGDVHSEIVTISVGISEFQASNIIDVEELLEQATTALDIASTAGMSSIQIFSPKMLQKNNPLGDSVDKPVNNALLDANEDISKIGDFGNPQPNH